MTIDELVEVSYNQARDKGWTEKEVPIPEMIALLHSEISEGLEEFRAGAPISYTSDSGKPEGIGSEFADTLIRIGHYSKLLGIDLNYEIVRKLAYNQTRPHRHGGKVV